MFSVNVGTLVRLSNYHNHYGKDFGTGICIKKLTNFGCRSYPNGAPFNEYDHVLIYWFKLKQIHEFQTIQLYSLNEIKEGIRKYDNRF